MDLSEVWKHLILHRSQTLYAAPHGNKTLEMSNLHRPQTTARL